MLLSQAAPELTALLTTCTASVHYRSDREAVVNTKTVEAFTPTHHALMIAWISRALVDAVGESEGERIIRKGVVKYGNQRGRRMALRAEANGHPRTIANYLAYAEVKTSSATKSQVVEKSPHARTHMLRCDWHDAWEDDDLMRYGRYFCMEIDRAVVQGFNDRLVLEVNGTMSNGADYCDFVFKDANLTLLKLAPLAWKRAIRPGKRAVMPWEYHVGHLYRTLGDVITEELGARAADVARTALSDFADRYGEPAAEIVLSYQATDFDQLP